MKIYFLGTNGWYDTKTGNTVSVLLETKNKYIIFDAGNGLYKIDKYVKKCKPVYLFLSHFHIDHIAGFHILDKFQFPQGIDVFGPPGLKLLFKRVINKPYTIPISKVKTKVRLHEIVKQDTLPCGIEYRPLKHSVPCFGYRVLSENKIISYCTDTGICENLIKLAKDSDLFITECSFKAGEFNRDWPHLNPESAAKVASQAEVRRLALIHFDASRYLNLKQRMDAGKVSRKIFKNTSVCFDDMKITL
jgi:ribonuclease BN (tRNA processing enzyme)